MNGGGAEGRAEGIIFGAMCAPCQLATTPYQTSLEALSSLIALHRERDELAAAAEVNYLCRAQWEIVKVKTSPPVAEERFHPYPELGA